MWPCLSFFSGTALLSIFFPPLPNHKRKTTPITAAVSNVTPSKACELFTCREETRSKNVKFVFQSLHFYTVLGLLSILVFVPFFAGFFV